MIHSRRSDETHAAGHAYIARSLLNDARMQPNPYNRSALLRMAIEHLEAATATIGRHDISVHQEAERLATQKIEDMK